MADSYWKEVMKKMKDILQQKSLIYFLSFSVGLLLLLNVSAYSAPKDEDNEKIKAEPNIPKWRKVAVITDAFFGSIIDEKWCGNSALVYFHITDQEYGEIKKGGIKFYDIKTGKGRWIIENPKTSRPFCSGDGTIVFWYGGAVLDNFKDNAKIGTTATLWGYDTKTNRTWRVAEGNLLNLNGDINLVWASPIDKTILFLGFNQKELASLSINLPNWRILKISVETLWGKMCRGGDWARDANYFYLNIEPYNIFTGISEGCQMAIYNANGELQRYVSSIPQSKDRIPDKAVVVQGGYLILDRLSKRIIRMDIETGEKRSYQIPEGTSVFDISPKGEAIYRIKSEKGPNLWFTNKLEGKPYLLEYRVISMPRFSPDGEYIYFQFYEARKQEGIILKRE